MDTVVTLQGNVKKKCHTQNKRKRNKTNRIVRYKAQQNVTQIGKTEKNLFKGNPFFELYIYSWPTTYCL